MVFHQQLLILGGDPTGTGEGGESVYGEPFRDEFHSRLRFVRRGLVGMANSGKDDNGSQFFFTFGPTQELQNKHTLFGKVVGDTIYNMLKLQDVEVGDDERALRPHKILRTKVLINPFPEIEPRKSISNLLDDEAESKKKKPKSKMKATKDYSLLSFGDEAEEFETSASNLVNSKKSKSSHDLLDDPKLSKDVGLVKNTEEPEDPHVEGDEVEAEKVEEVSMESLRDKLKRAKDKKAAKRKALQDGDDDHEPELKSESSKVDQQKKRKEEIRKEIRALKKDLMSGGLEGEKSKMEAEDTKSKIKRLTEEEKANDLLLAFHADQEKYAKVKPLKKGSARENQTMDILSKFKNKLFEVKQTDEKKGDVEDDDDDDDDDGNWMANTLKFVSDEPILAKDANTKDDDWFDIYDPRNPVNKRRREADAKKNSGKKPK